VTASVSPKPYLLRAMHEWISDCGHTPHVIVDATYPGAQVPKAYVKDGKIVLNLSMKAAPTLKLGNDEIELDTRFGGVSHRLRFPVEAVLGIYARETGEGMPLDTRDASATATAAVPPPATAEEGAPEGPAQAPAAGAAAKPAGGRPQLRVVK
jgi:stringent starvation protein B